MSSMYLAETMSDENTAPTATLTRASQGHNLDAGQSHRKLEEDVHNLIAERIKVKEGRRLVTCNICLRVFASNISLRKHMLSHSDVQKVEAFTEMLQNIPGDEQNIPGEEQNIPGEEQNIPGDEQGQGLELPQSTRSRQTFECDSCEKAYLSKNSLRRHKRLTHAQQAVDFQEGLYDHGPVMFACGVCHDLFLDIESVNHHLQISHEYAGMDEQPLYVEEHQNVYAPLESNEITLNEGHVRKSDEYVRQPSVAPGPVDGETSIPSDENTAVVYVCSLCNEQYPDENGVLEHCQQMHGADQVIEDTMGLVNQDVIIVDESQDQAVENLVEPKPEGLSPLHAELPEVMEEEARTNESEEQDKGSSEFLCKQCGVGFLTVKSLRSHTCDHSAMNQSDLNRGPHDTLKCKDCGKTFPSDQQMKLCVLSDKGDKQFLCNHCKEKFWLTVEKARQKRLQAREIGPKCHKCNMCNKAFSQSSHLKTHILSHIGAKPYQCDFCDKRFLMHSHLKVHIRSHTDERPYKCTLCSKAFHSNSHLKTHLRGHAGERPYECPICKKRFLVSTHLKTHISSAHLPQSAWPSKYGCEFCGKVFVQSSHLKSHLKIHRGERPYECFSCKETFTNSSLLKGHTCVIARPSETTGTAARHVDLRVVDRSSVQSASPCYPSYHSSAEETALEVLSNVIDSQTVPLPEVVQKEPSFSTSHASTPQQTNTRTVEALECQTPYGQIQSCIFVMSQPDTSAQAYSVADTGQVLDLDCSPVQVVVDGSTTELDANNQMEYVEVETESE